MRKNAEIKNALDHIAPDKAAVDRMYLEIMRRAASQEAVPQKKPWYLRWQTSAGVCTAAMACVVVLVAFLHGRMPVDIMGELPVVTPSEVSEESSEIHMQTGTKVSEKAIVTAETTTVVVTSAAKQTKAVAEIDDSSDVQQCTETVPVQTVPAALPQTSFVNTTPNVPETRPAVTTVLTKKTTAAMQTAETVQTTAAPLTEEAGNATGSEEIPIRQNIYLYYTLMYNGIRYNTQYVSISGNKLDYIGPGVTKGDDVEDTHTVLIYAIKGDDTSRHLAVQYVGETNYYIFTAVAEDIEE